VVGEADCVKTEPVQTRRCGAISKIQFAQCLPR
jgi:hypothetical protein